MKFQGRAAAGILALALASGAIIAAALLGCASRPQVSFPEPTLSLTVRPPELLDQNRVLLVIEATARNPRLQALSIESAECAIAVEGASAPLMARLLPSAPPASLPARTEADGDGEAALRFEAEIDLGTLDDSVMGPEGPAVAAFSAVARIKLYATDGSPFQIVAASRRSIPIIREPEIRIRSLRIERDVLVTSNLRLGIELRNPNAFPIEMGRLSYAFYGEGRKWASGAEEESFTVPARAISELGLAFEMNFADVDRRLFDLVSKLGTIGYELSGSARVATGLKALPAFDISFDIEGSCPVER